MAYITFQPSDHFNTKLWTGNGSAGNAQTGVGFQPDLVWYKARSQAYNSGLFDVVRGTSKQIYSDQNSVEATYSGVTSFDNDGFTLGTDAGGNGNGVNYVAWNWKAGNSQGSSNTDGSINTTYTSVNTTAGFSISKYTGTGSNATIGHGLGVAPKMVMIKNTSTAESWIVGHKSLGFTKFLSLDTTNAAQTTSNRFNDTDPTSSVFSVGSADGTNKSGDTIIAYCFAEKTGFSKIGSYKGNGSTWGPFVNCGFKPAWILWKRTDSANGWILMDNKRPTVNSISYGSNPQNVLLEAQSNGAEATSTSYHVNFLSNGFKIKNTNNVYNNTSGSYVYMAFADEPLVSSNNIAATGN